MRPNWKTRRALAGWLVLVCIACGAPSAPTPSGPVAPADARAAVIRGSRVELEVVSGRAEQARGLGYRDSLAWGHGMLFVYPEPRVAAFWMKGMRFAIDIVWIRDGRIRQIHHRVPPPEGSTPDAALPKYQPSELVDQVLEVPAGFAQANAWARGDAISLE